MTDAELEVEYSTYFDANRPKEPYYAWWDEDGSFEIRTRASVKREYIDRRFQCLPDYSGQYKGFRTFAEAKSYVYGFLKSWAREISDSAREVRKIKKGDLS